MYPLLFVLAALPINMSTISPLFINVFKPWYNCVDPDPADPVFV
jgi:hypothetical protein